MRQKSETPKVSSEQIVKDIRRATRKHYSAEDKIRIVLDGLRGEYSIADMSIMPWLRFPERQGVDIDDYPNLKNWRDRIAARPAVKKALEVLADRRRTTPSFSKEQAEVLFGATQYARR